MTSETVFPHLPSMLLYFTFLCTVMCFLGSSNNIHNSKYLRARTADCESYMISVRLNDDHSICCDLKEKISFSFFSLSLCDATLHWSNRILSSGYALFIPFLPFLSTLLIDMFFGKKPLNASLRDSYKSRGLTYLIIILYRLYILYKIADYVQRAVQEAEGTFCWYAHLVKHGKCKDNYDFSDHIVLYMVQYALPSLAEICYALKLSWRRYLPTIMIAALLLITCLKGVFLTSSYFHTAEECYVAILVSVVLAYLPAIYLM